MVIINGKILTMEDEIIECGYLRICGSKIAEIGSMDFYENSSFGKKDGMYSGFENERQEKGFDGVIIVVSKRNFITACGFCLVVQSASSHSCA